MQESILVEHEGGITTVILNRPHKMNALTKSMWQQLGQLVSALSDDESVRCIVFRGAGDRAFSVSALGVMIDNTTYRSPGGSPGSPRPFTLSRLPDCEPAGILS